MNNTKINWQKLVTNTTQPVLVKFAKGEITKNDAAKALAYTEYAGHFRNLVRSLGTDQARIRCKQVLRQRSIM